MILLLSMCRAGLAQETAPSQPDPLDRVITITGADEAALPIPAPWSQQEVAIPELVPVPQPIVTLPAIEPPAGDWGAGGAAAGVTDALGPGITGAPPP